jgi:hypothetical protein
MLNKQFARQIFLILLVVSLALPGVVVRAQGRAFAAIVSPDFSKFPTVTTLLDTFDEQGQFISGLVPSDVVILENGQEAIVDTLQELQLPISVVIAINSGPVLGMRDSFGISRYDKIAAVISNWAAARPEDSKDDISLAWNGGVVASHFPPGEWKARFDEFDPAQNAQTGLAALSFGLDAAQNAQTLPGQKKAVLFVSGHLDASSVDGVEDLSERAKQAGVRIYVWLADSEAFLSHPGSLRLQELADDTGGQFLTFTGTETLPDPEEWFSPLRHIYQLTYTSHIRSDGQQSLSMQVNANGLALTTAAVSFQLDVQPPNPALLSPPIQIVRQNSDKPFDIESFLPTQQEISALVEFPDGHPRNLKRTALYVDGQKVAENTAEPFDKFTWDLSPYVASGEHTLEIEAEDELGLVRKSSPVPVQITVLQPPGGVFGLLLRNTATLTISLVVLAGAVLLVILFLGGRLRLSSFSEHRKSRAQKNDPVTQPVPAAVEVPGQLRSAPFPWLRRKTSPPLAYFVKLTPEGQPSSGDPVALSSQEMTFGTDPTQATHILDHPSISPLHARLRINENGGFQLIDQNSVAGTWVNFEAILKEGYTLKHGDVIHFGQLTYRFVLSKPPATIKPTITPD